MKLTTPRLLFVLLCIPALLPVGCARPQPTAEEVAGRISPPDLRAGRNPPGGPSMAPTGGGAGGSAAGGMQYQLGVRNGGPSARPTMPPQPYGVTYSRMSPVDSSGSGDGDRGNPIPPEVPLAAPPDKHVPASNVPPLPTP